MHLWQTCLFSEVSRLKSSRLMPATAASRQIGPATEGGVLPAMVTGKALEPHFSILVQKKLSLPMFENVS